MKKFIIIYTVSLSFAFTQYRYGTTTANFLEIGVSSNAVAMGEAYVSMADDAISAYWNPAGLANISGLEFGFSTQDWVVGIKHSSFATAINMGNYGTISAWFTDFDYGSIEVTNVSNQNGTGEFYNANEISASLAYGRNLVDWFSFGASLKMIKSNIWHSSAKATALDLGVIVKTDFFTFSGDKSRGMKIGMSISNYGTRMKYDGIDLIQPIDPSEDFGNYADVKGKYETSYWELPLIFRIGVSNDFFKSKYSSLIVAIDAIHPNNDKERINIGLKYSYNYPRLISFYIGAGFKGMHTQIRGNKIQFSSPFGPALGIGMSIPIQNKLKLKFNYTVRSVGVFGFSKLVTIGLNF